MLKYTQKQFKDYKKSYSRECPHCGSDKIIVSESYQQERTQVLQNISCMNCDKDWQEVFELKKILHLN